MKLDIKIHTSLSKGDIRLIIYDKLNIFYFKI